MAQTKRLIILTIVLATLAVQVTGAPKAKPKAAAKPAPKVAAGKVNVVPGTVIALPSGCKVKVRWVCPPLDTKSVSEAHWYDMHFVVDSKGRPWFGTALTNIINPTQCYQFTFQLVYDDIACLENGTFLVATSSDLGFVAVPDKPAADDKEIPIVAFQPIAGLPLHSCKLFAGAGNVLYLLGRNPESGLFEVYLLRREKLATKGAGLREYVKVLSSEDEISAVAGDGDITYVAIDRAIMKSTQANGTLTKVFVHPTETIKGLAYSPKSGLFYASRSGIGLVGSKGTMQILGAEEPDLYLQKDSLYVLFPKSLGVLALDGVGDLKRFDRPIKEIPATQSKEVKVTGIRFFEAGETPPNDAELKYTNEFDKASTRFVYCQVDMTNLLKGKPNHKQQLSAELLWPGGASFTDSAETTVDFNRKFDAWARLRFGDANAGTFYPGVYTLKTYLNGSKIDERHFTVKGEPNVLEAAWNSDPAAMRKLLDGGADPNVVNGDGESPLVMAVSRASVENVRLLLDHKADVEAKNADGKTPLLIAAGLYGDNSAIVRLLLEHGADVNAVDKDGKTALHAAASDQRLETMRVLLEHKANPNALDKDGKTPLLALDYSMPGSQYQATPAQVELLLRNGADPNLADKDNGFPLSEAISGPDLDLAQALIDGGADLTKECKYSDGEAHSLLYWAIISREIETDRFHREVLRKIAKLLCDKGAVLRPDEVSYVLSIDWQSVLGRKQVVAALETNNQNFFSFKPEDPWLRKYVLKRILDFAWDDISRAPDASWYTAALNCSVAAKNRAEEWGLATQMPYIYFNCGMLAVKTGDNANAKAYLTKYLELAPNGDNADKAQAMLNGM